MGKKTSITFIMLLFSLVAFLSGYLISQKDNNQGLPELKTGSLLDKFESEIDAVNKPEPPFRLISKVPAVSATNSPRESKVLYYEKDTGHVLESSLNNTGDNLISGKDLPNFIKTIWSPNKNEVVSLFYSLEGIRHKYFNYTTKRSVDLGDEIRSLAFSPLGEQTVVFSSNRKLGKIYLALPDGSSTKKLLDTRVEEVTLYWPRDNLILAKIRDTNNNYGIFSLDREGILKKLLDFKPGLDIKISPDGRKILLSSYNEHENLVLSLLDLDARKESPLGLVTTASKCTWSIDNKTVICGQAVPNNSGDVLLELDTLNSSKKAVGMGIAERFIVQDLFLSSLENYVIILNALDGRLYALKR